MNIFTKIFQHNWLAIFYFNFKMLPFKQAIKLPFDFYHHIRFENLSGKIIINLKSATKPLNVLIAFTRPLITEFADNLNLKHPLLPTISPYPTM